MAKNIHRGSELSNISETWDQNERNLHEGNAASSAGTTENTAGTGNEDLDEVIRKEASEYDHSNKEDRLLGGERATVNDDPDASSGDDSSL